MDKQKHGSRSNTNNCCNNNSNCGNNTSGSSCYNTSVSSNEQQCEGASDKKKCGSGEGDGGSDRLSNLIVNYLPQTMSQDEIRSLFASMGEIESCKLVRDKNTGQSLGYGFINYKTPEQACKAIEALNGLRLQNKTIKVSLARPSCDLIKGANLYVSGLPRDMTQKELEMLFKPCGQIITSRILADPNTGLSKGVGFIRFDLRTEADIAIKQFNGKVAPNGTDTMTVKFANHPSSSTLGCLPSPPHPPYLSIPRTAYMTPTRSSRGGAAEFDAMQAYPGSTERYGYSEPMGAAGLVCNMETGGGCNGVSNTLYYGCNEMMLGGDQIMEGGGGNGGYSLFVYNLPAETVENSLWKLFGPFGAVQSVKVMRESGSQKCRGYGFVMMTNYDEACLAISHLHGYQIGDRMLQVSFKKSREHDLPPRMARSS